jgi:2-haloacid dehalogenase
MTNYTTLLLDFDHTLLDSDESEARALDTTLRSIGIDDPEAHRGVYRALNSALWKRVETGELDPNTVKVLRFSQMIEYLGIDADPVEMGETFVQGLGASGGLFPGARSLLDELAARASLAMVTNGIGFVQRTRVARLDLEQYFEAIVISGEVGTSKPGSAIFDLTFEQLGEPSRDASVMIGDNLNSDIRGGAGFGIDTCWYNPSGQTAEPAARVTHEVRSFDQMLATLYP